MPVAVAIRLSSAGMIDALDPSDAPGSRLCALLTTFNRRDLTLACLRALEDSMRAAELSPRAIVVDDASRDGTAAAIVEAFPWVTVIAGSGELYWCRGMHRAFAEAMAIGFDGYLWLNDDTVLDRPALRILRETARRLRGERGAPVIVVGTTADPQTGARTYGGELRPSRWRPLAVAPLAPRDTAQRCDAMSGNIVFVPADAAARVGNVDAAFEHAMGDTDYALRARRAGVEVWLAPGVLGTCRANPVDGSFGDPALPLAERWRRMQQRKGLPWRSWLRFARRHGGWAWPVYFASPYVRLLLSGMRRVRGL